jgi:hypothetical protein
LGAGLGVHSSTGPRFLTSSRHQSFSQLAIASLVSETSEDQVFVALKHAEVARELLQVDVMGDDSTVIDDEKIADTAARWCGARFPQRLAITRKRTGEALYQRSLRERYKEWGLSTRQRHRLRAAAVFLVAQPDVGRPIANHGFTLSSEFFDVCERLLCRLRERLS